MSDAAGPRRLTFVTGTRADFGKLKPIIRRFVADSRFEVHVFVTGMHMLSQYGSTYTEVEKEAFPNVYKFINQNLNDGMDHALAKTVLGLSDYLREVRPHLLVVHGDRVEALAGASVGALNDTLVGHIEGGEVSGTVDESIRHAVSKLSHLHFVSNEEARSRLLQLGELDASIHVIGSPDVDVMNSPDLPSLGAVKDRFDIEFDEYGVVLMHPVTSEGERLAGQIDALLRAMRETGRNYVVIYPNNDRGSERIITAYAGLEQDPHFRVYPSMRFEYFLTLLRNAQFMIGNSSAGVREAPHYGTPTVNLGSRQHGRTSSPSIIDAPFHKEAILVAIDRAVKTERVPQALFGNGNSADAFHRILTSDGFWRTSTQKVFVDRLATNGVKTDYLKEHCDSGARQAGKLAGRTPSRPILPAASRSPVHVPRLPGSQSGWGP